MIAILSGFDLDLCERWSAASSHFQIKYSDELLNDLFCFDNKKIVWLYLPPWAECKNDKELSEWLSLQRKVIKLFKKRKVDVTYVNASKVHFCQLLNVLCIANSYSKNKVANSFLLDFESIFWAESFSVFAPEYLETLEKLESSSLIVSVHNSNKGHSLKGLSSTNFFQVFNDFQRVKDIGELEKDKDSLMSQVGFLQDELKFYFNDIANKNAGCVKGFEGEIDKELIEKGVDSLLILQLHEAQEKLEKYFLGSDNSNDIKSPKKPTTPIKVYYGASDRIKTQLSYRLGATTIVHTRSVRGWIKLPRAVWQEKKAFQKDRALQQEKGKLPPIAHYQDANKAEQVRKHLSYRIGSAMVKHGKYPWGWLWLPFAIVGAKRAFNKERAEKRAQRV
ncbi:hypothetical protein [Candidatus Sororendozoicomonas aggregata]|uniref:hypothetical protein n=1 Tax=Candidatus Sororendozoicomonas aggregata TaxID=3073239 RepID=UPI002ECFF233